MLTATREIQLPRKRLVAALLAVWGPGLVVMLADTDAGSLITAAQSGAKWGYRMVLPQLVLIPILYVVQEMTVRLGIVTGKGHGALIREHFGRGWALLSVGTLFISAIGALLTEFAGVAGVGELFGLPRPLTIPVATALLIGVGVTGNYRLTERIGIALGLGELAFIPALLMAHPSIAAIGHGLEGLPIGNSSYLMLLAANVGAVIMPWMIFYQQGAVIDKGLHSVNIRSERRDTAIGAILTQLIMVTMVLVFATAVGRTNPGATLNTVGDMIRALQPYVNATVGKIMFGGAVLGAALVAALVASIAGAWGLSEVFGWNHTLNKPPSRQNAKFYTTYILAHILGAVVVLLHVNLVRLILGVMVMNALLLPVVLGFLLALEARVLPCAMRMHGPYRWVVSALSLLVIGFGIYLVPVILGLA